tara:strand:- start:329 stop:508 length:180 start_codon:yes stop_codon:yes gene_type:complete
MAAGVDPIGQTDEISAQGTIDWKVVISNRRARTLLIVLAVLMTVNAPDKAVVLLRLIGV